MLPFATHCFENEAGLIRDNLWKTNFGFRLQRGDVYGLTGYVHPEIVVKGQAVANVAQLDPGAMCAWSGSCLYYAGAHPGWLNLEIRYHCRPKFQWCLEGLTFSSVSVQAFCG